MLKLDLLEVGSQKFVLEQDKSRIIVSSEGRTWENISDLLRDKQAQLSQFPSFLAHVVFHMLLKENYQLIEDENIPAERSLYKEALEHSRNRSVEILDPHAFGGPYDIDVLHPAEVREGFLEFFVRQRGTAIPMNVRVPLLDYAPEKIMITRLPTIPPKDKHCQTQ